MSADRTQFSQSIKGRISGLKCSVGERENGESSFHDSFDFTASMGYEIMHETLAAMGMSNTTFVDDLPDEAPRIALASLHFKDQTLKIRASGRLLVNMDRCEVMKVVVHKTSETSFNLYAKIKGLPTLDQHFAIEKVILDCHAEQSFMFEFGLAPQASLDLGDADEEDDAVPAIPSNVSNIGERL